MQRKVKISKAIGFGKRCLLQLAFLLLFSTAPAVVSQADEGTVVEYDNLRQLLIDGSLELSQANDSYETSKKNYQEILDSLREEQEYMRFLAKKYEDDEEAKSTYSSNAAILGSSATQISKQIERLNTKSQSLTSQQNIDSYLITAQARMNSYNQMVLNVAAKEKSVQAAEASYQATVKKQASGAATSADVLSAADALEQEKNLLSSYQQQAASLRFSLLSMLGITDDGTVTIGTLPEPDLAAIDAIDYEADKETAVNNNSTVKSVRHSAADTNSEILQKNAEEAEATGTAESEIYSAYQDLLASKLTWQAASDAWESAKIAYQSLQLKNQAGMLNNTDYLNGEAEYLQAAADMGAASMNLQQAYETYQWTVLGRSGI